MLHGVELYNIVGEGTIGGALAPPEMMARGPVNAFAAAAADPFITREKLLLAPRQTFCRLFDKGVQQDAAALSRLGMAMEGETAGSAGRDSSIPAGFTYLGQFVDHDITFDKTPLAGTGTADPTGADNHRTPALDLDSVYGGGPQVRPDLYQPDGASLKVGLCTPTDEPVGGQIGALPNDLPREANRRAIIGDPRNDENLAVAQLHLAFIKFHNSFVDELKASSPSLPPLTLFRRARQATILRYQRLLLRDFLPKIIDTNAIEAVLTSGHRIFPADLHAFMPIEFSVAAYRLGHSMIRSSYEWNRVFHSKPGALAAASLELLFEFSQVSGSTSPSGDDPFFGAPTLPANWPVDWRLLFEVQGENPPVGFAVNRARKIDTHLADVLKKLPEFLVQGVSDPALLSLASRNLLRARLVELADGFQAADAILATGLNIRKLTASDLAGGPHGGKLQAEGLAERPPLWYYILREAELHNGERLGDVGSAIVAETLVAHIRNADVSILADPSINSLADIPEYSMSRLLKRVDDLTPV